MNALIVLVIALLVGLWTFDGSPSSPQSVYNNLAGWDVTIDGAENGDQTFTTAQAHHGANCSPPMATHPVSSFENAIFQCRDHFMTVGEGGDGKYTIISLTPPSLVDFTSGEGIIKFDMSTWRQSDRDWVEFWLTPFSDNLTEPHTDWLPAANGEPRRGIMIKMENRWNGTGFDAAVVRNFNVQDLFCDNCNGYESFLIPSAERRDTFEIRITKTSLKFCMPNYGECFVDTTFADLGWSQAVFQIQHSTYNPTKGGCVQACGVNTWHWDNVSIEPSIPFTIIRSDKRTLGIRQNGTFNFHSPAPENSFLRFSGLGLWDYSVNGGQTWQAVTKQAQESNRPEHSSSYWTAIPAGTQHVMLRGRGELWNSAYIARDVSIWSLTTSSLPPTATPSPLPTNTPTNTPIPTMTPTPQPTAECVLMWNGIVKRQSVTTEAECN